MWDSTDTQDVSKSIYYPIGMSKTGYLGNLLWFVCRDKGIWLSTSKVIGQVERLQKKKTTQRFTDSLLFLSKATPWFIVNIPLSRLLGDNSERCFDYKGRDLGNCYWGAETNFPQFNEESKLIQVFVEYRLPFWKTIWGHILSTHRFNCNRTIARLLNTTAGCWTDLWVVSWICL